MKTKKYITENTLMAEIVEKYPEVAEVLTMEYGFHCMGCFAAEMETLGQGASVHGMTDKEMKKMLEVINKLAEK
jgi:hybrid cluster-associated redox disulfide protein